MWRTCLQGQRDLGGQLGISLFISLLFDLVALSFPCLISYIFKVYCDEIWPYLSYKGFWSSLGSSLWRKIVGSGCQSSGWPRSLLYLVWKEQKKKKKVVTAWALPPRFAGVTQELEFPSSLENDPASLGIHIRAVHAGFMSPLSRDVGASWFSFQWEELDRAPSKILQWIL